VPGMSPLAMFWNDTNPSMVLSAHQSQDAAAKLGLTIQSIGVRGSRSRAVLSKLRTRSHAPVRTHLLRETSSPGTPKPAKPPAEVRGRRPQKRATYVALSQTGKSMSRYS
jgi:hypothetical protein